MDRVNRILTNEKYKMHLEKINAAEENRLFCCHNMNHFLDVARIAMQINLEESLKISKEFIYVTALLHDIGRHVQYADGTPHEKASVVLAPEILTECGFSEEEQKEILEAIGNHRSKEIAGEKNLSGIIYRGDKLSRPCFSCKAEKECDWSKSKKNLYLEF